jgi:hypothetical protein
MKSGKAHSEGHQAGHCKLKPCCNSSQSNEKLEIAVDSYDQGLMSTQEVYIQIYIHQMHVN